MFHLAIRSLILSACLVGVVAAADIDRLRLGESLVGSKPEAEALKGKAVFVELWGIH